MSSVNSGGYVEEIRGSFGDIVGMSSRKVVENLLASVGEVPWSSWASSGTIRGDVRVNARLQVVVGDSRSRSWTDRRPSATLVDHLSSSAPSPPPPCVVGVAAAIGRAAHASDAEYVLMFHGFTRARHSAQERFRFMIQLNADLLYNLLFS